MNNLAIKYLPVLKHIAIHKATSEDTYGETIAIVVSRSILNKISRYEEGVVKRT